MKINTDELQFKFKFKDGDDDLVANMNLTIGQFEIRGYSIRKSKFTDNRKRFVLYPPASRMLNGTWLKIVFMQNKDEWQKFEKKVLETFDIEHTDYLISHGIKNEVIDEAPDRNKELDVSQINF